MASFSFTRPAPRPASSPAPDAASAAPGTAAEPPRFSFGAAAAAAAVPEIPQLDEQIGTLADLRMYGDWGRGRIIDSETGRRITVTGPALVGLQVGQRYRFSGKRVQHEKFGEQIEVSQAVPDIESVDALIDLMKRNYRGLGQGTAKRMAEFHRHAGSLELLAEQLVYSPGSVDFTVVTDRPISLHDDENSAQRRVRDSLALRFSGLGVQRPVIAELARWLMGRAQKQIDELDVQGRTEPLPEVVALSNDILEANPYAPMAEVDRYSFGTADLIGRRLGVAPNDPMRIAAIVTYALQEGCLSEGHMWLTQGQFFSAIRRMDPSLNPKDAFELALEREEPIVIDASHGSPRYYIRRMREAEDKLVSHIVARLTTDVDALCPLEGAELERAIDLAVANVGQAKGMPNFALDGSQRQALSTILSARISLHTLTAGPGCGKTAIVEVLMEVLGRTQYEVQTDEESEQPAGKRRRARHGVSASRTTFCAPIGKAAKVLSSRIKQWGVAKTIHSTLEFREGFERNAENPLETDFVIADEQSMLGGLLGAAFFDATPINAHLLMLGDTDQLAPIEPGQVLKSLLEIDGLDHHRLTKTHRNQGAILEIVQQVNQGNWPGPARMGELLAKGDVSWKSLPEPTPSAFAQLALEVRMAAQAHGGLERVGVICPKRKGKITEPDWNVTYLNHVLRDALNPDPQDRLKVTGTTFRLNDRVIINKNMMLPLAPAETDGLVPISAKGGQTDDTPVDTSADDGDDEKTYVVNGDTGWLEKAAYTVEDGYKKVGSLVLRLDDGRRVEFPGSDLDMLNLAYAITVHAAQGSEYAAAFCCVTPGNEQFMHRALMMTEFSRAQHKLNVLGEESVIATVASRPAPQRNCAIVERVFEQIERERETEPMPERQTA